MTDKTQELMQKFADYIQETEATGTFSGGEIAHVYWMDGKENCHLSTSRACHAAMASSSLNTAKMIGCGIPNMNKKDPATVDFLNWLVSDQSVYYPIIRWLGDKFKVVRDKDGIVIGWVVGTNDLNRKAATNFWKATRTVNEHRSNLPFWKKWKMDRGMHPGLTFVLSYFVSINGDKRQNGHSCLESHWCENPLDIYKVLHPDHHEWDSELSKTTFAQTTSYSGENRFTWSVTNGRKGIKMHYIPIVKHEKMVTRFWHLYQKKEESKYTDETLEAFYKNVESYV